MTDPMLPPPPDPREPAPTLVDWDASVPAWNEVPGELRETWRPGRFESDSPEAA